VNRLAHTVARRRSHRPEDPLLSPFAPIFSDDGHGRPVCARPIGARFPSTPLGTITWPPLVDQVRTPNMPQTQEMGLRPTSCVEIRANQELATPGCRTTRRPTRPNPDRQHHKHADTSTASVADSCANNVAANSRAAGGGYGTRMGGDRIRRDDAAKPVSRGMNALVTAVFDLTPGSAPKRRGHRKWTTDP